MDEYDNKRIKESIDEGNTFSNDDMLDKFDFRLIRDFAKFANTNEKEIQTILDNRNPEREADRIQDNWERDN